MPDHSDKFGFGRREFMALSCAAVAAMVTPGCGSSASASEKGKFGAKHEWDPLKEAVVGLTNLKSGSYICSVEKRFLPPESIELMSQHLGETLEIAFPDKYQQAIAQINMAKSILESRGVKIHQLSPITDLEESYLNNIQDGYCQFFPRDPMLVVDNYFIETEPRFPMRRKERFPAWRTLKDRLRELGADILSMPLAELEGPETEFGPGPFLEGGDVLLVGKKILVGISGNASNEAGAEWLQKLLPDHDIEIVRLKDSLLHLDCAMSLPRPGLAVVCKEAFVDGLPQFMIDEEWETIEVSLYDAEHKLGCNGLVIDPKTILIADSMPDLAEALDKAGQEVITTPFDAVYFWGGAFRCWHHPLYRG